MKSAPSGPIGVAVSGGSDSVALLNLLTVWAGTQNRRIMAVTVDHRLRDGSLEEAEGVARLCKQLDVTHTILDWDSQNFQGNLQDAARRARIELISEWARQHGIHAVATGHTRDDQAETFLQRLKRGSGVDGLSAMAPIITKNELIWLRPLLFSKRVELRDYLREHGLKWVEDPSNDDDRFDRVKIRKALPELEKIGLGVDVIADAAQHLARARVVLEQAAFDCAKLVAAPRDIGSVRIDVPGLKEAHAETAYRVLAHSLRWVSGARYRPRFKALELAMQAISGQHAHSLSGCLIVPINSQHVEICREVSAMQELVTSLGVLDGRWHCEAEKGVWRALGDDGILQCTNWRTSGESRKAVLASPSLWCNNELKSAPFVDNTRSCKCSLVGGTESFYASLLTH